MIINLIYILKKIKIFFIIFIFIIISQTNIKINYFKLKNQIKIVKYYKINNQGILINKKNHLKNISPKVSIISAVYNREEYILRFMRSIQNQFFDDIEIIFVDDYSYDKSVNIIERLRQSDKRIILLKNKKNRGTLISRNIGALKAKGEYLIFPDTDDILSSNIINDCYKTAKQFDYDIIRFNMYSDKKFPFSIISNKLNKIIYQPDLRTHLIYGYGYKKLVDGIIINKFIKKNIYLITLNNISNYYLIKKMIYFEDGLMNFALHLNAKSLYLLNQIGYYYIYNDKSISHSINFDSYFSCFFTFLKFILDNTKNNKYEKDINFFILQEYTGNNDILKRIKIYLKIYEEIINSLLKIRFLNSFNKNKLKDIKNIILNIKYNKTIFSF